MNPIEYSQQKSRDGKTEHELCKWLRLQTEHDKFQFVWRVIRENAHLGLPLVEKIQLRTVYLEVILEHGFVYSDVSTIKHWLRATQKGLGLKKIILMVESHIEDAPSIVDKTLYWLRTDKEKLKEKIRNLKKVFEEKYPHYKPISSRGIM